MTTRSLILVVLIFIASCGADNDESATGRFADRLTRGSWSRTVGGEPFHTRYTYEFHDDGTYRQAVFSDFVSPPSEGTWTITRDADGQTHLVLSPNQSNGDCYWLACDSIAFFRGNQLVVTGGSYVGEQTLEHTPPLREVTE